jgi:CHAT domain-containing protein
MLRRSQLREVFLSSCAAGVVGNGVSEEHEGLASAMLVAGANTVISALWPVDQIPTALLSLYYYMARREKDLSPAEALAWAQKKLRRTTAKQARDLLARLPTQRSWDLGQLKGVRPSKIEPKPAISLRGVKPFVDSRHWAGFYCLSQT